MKRKLLLFSFSVLLTGIALVSKAANPEASIVLANAVLSNHLTHFTVTDPNNEPYTIQTLMGEWECRQIPGSKYAYFHVEDATIGSAENNLIITLTYYDNGTDDLAFQYNATGGVNYKHISIKKTATNTWITATIALTDASLRNAQNNAADFRIGTTTGFNNYIREITITKGTLNPAGESVPATTGSTYSEFIGKSVAGYQVWFNTGTPTSGWFHWSGGAQPSVGHLNFEVYPDVKEYASTDLTQTGFDNLGDGSPSELFHSSNATVINKHFSWMQSAGIDGVALQRFINGIGPVINNSPAASPLKVKSAAESTNKIFYICYDISSTGLDDTWDDIIKFDWVYNIEQAYALTSSPAYATVNNKPVVQLWGTGFTGNHPGTAQETIDLIHFLQARGCYVIGGVPTYWLSGINDSKANFLDAYKEFDMISPWSVGRFGDVAGATDFKNNQLIPDKAYTDQHNIAYMPVLFPGFSWSQWNNGLPNSIPRKAGDFSWNQALNIKSIGVSNMYFAMFDEYDEGTAIMKAATDYTMIPTDQYFVTTSADGIWTSSDFYLRLAAAETQMLKGTRPVTSTVPIVYSEGPVYYRNSFEKRFATYDQGSGYFNIDPCFYKDVSVSSNNISNQSVTIENNPAYAKTGLFAAKITGTPNSSTAASHYYKIAETKIKVKANMELSFWKYSYNTLGQYTSVDLLFQSGKRLKNLTAYVDNNGNAMTPSVARGTVGSWQHYTCQIGKGELVGEEITGIIIAYDFPSATGNYTAYFDDILIEDAEATDPGEAVAMVNPLYHQFRSPLFESAGTGNMYTADPSAHVWADGRLYVYASHDIEPAVGCDRMDRYHVFSTDDMSHWVDHGEILNSSQVTWGRAEGGFMWAPDCAYNPANQTYYFYYPHPSGTDWGATWKIGVATSAEPAANFTDQGYIAGLESLIDPCVFVDDDGQPYFYHGGGGRCMGGKLDKNDWTKLDGSMQDMEGLVDFHEAAWVHKYNGKYYLSHSDNHGSDGNQLKYAVSDHPLGPWTDQGVYMYATGCDTHHGSIVEYQNQWWSFYHTSNFSGEYNLRSVCADKLYYNNDGTIQTVNNWGTPYNGMHTVAVTTNTTDIALTLEAEDFNEGGSHYGYWDKDETNRGNNTTYRPNSNVDIESHPNNVVNVGFMDNGEWLRYTVNVVQAGVYDIDFMVASGNTNGGKFHLSVNGTNLSGDITVPFTAADWGTWTTVTASNIVLQAGEQYIDLRINGGFNLDKLKFRKAAPYQGTPYNGPHDVPGTFEAEDYDNGGAGVAYFDSDAANNSGAGRTNEGVDVENSNGSIHLSWTNSGEWTKYTINVTQDGTYEVQIPVSTGNNASGSLSLSFDDTYVLPAASINTGNWNTYQILTIPNVQLTAGTHVMKLSLGGNINVDKFTFLATNIVTGIDESSPEMISIYPNPSSNGAFTIGTQQPGTLEVMDLTGNVVFSDRVAQQQTIHLVRPGIYIAKLSTKSKTYRFKLIVSK